MTSTVNVPSSSSSKEPTLTSLDNTKSKWRIQSWQRKPGLTASNNAHRRNNILKVHPIAVLVTAAVFVLLQLLHMRKLAEQRTIAQDLTHSIITIPSPNATAALAPSSLLSDEHFARQGAALARVYPKRDKQSWCGGGRVTANSKYTKLNSTAASSSRHYANHQQQQRDGRRLQLYVRSPKTGSSTVSGVMRRIAHRHGCEVMAQHFDDRRGPNLFRQPLDLKLGKQVLRVSNVRHPAKRAISTIYFKFFRGASRPPTDEQVIQYLRPNRTGCQPCMVLSPGKGGFQLSYLSLNEIPNYSAWSPIEPARVVDSGRAVEHNVKEVIDRYDFLVITERMDESLVVLHMLLGVDIGDILHVSAKVTGSDSKQPCNSNQGFLLRYKTYTSPAVEKILKSDDWLAMNYGDYVLYAAANQSLDRTIESLGVDNFQKSLAEYRKLQNRVKEECVDAGKVLFPCKEQNIVPDCYLNDQGCGYKCIDELLTTYTS